MKWHTFHPRFTFILSALIAMSALANPLTLQAQDRDKPFLRITDVDVSEFPIIEVFVYGENLNGNLASLPLTLEQDRAEKPVLTSQLADVGIQTAIVVDASSNISQQGNTGQPRLNEVASAVNDFLGLNVLSAQTDWLGLHATSDSQDSFQVLADWQQDHQAVANQLIQFQPTNAPDTTSLFGLIKFSFDQFENSGVSSNVRRSIVVFSDGTDIVSNVQVDDVVRRAESLDVRVHTVMIGPNNSREASNNLGRLADVTGGTYALLNNVLDVRAIWQNIAAERSQRVLTYRLDEEQPDELEVTITMPDGTQVASSKEYPTVGAQPVEISYVLPSAQLPLVREADSPDTPINEMLPNQLPIQLEFTWPDNRPRSFQRVEYSLNNNTQIVDEAPFNRFTFPVDELGEGDYTIRVNAVDELGVTSMAPPRTVRIEINFPEAVEAAEPAADAGNSGEGTEASTEANAEESDSTNEGAESSTDGGTNSQDGDEGEGTTGTTPAVQELDASGAESGNGISIFGYQLPETVTIAGNIIPVNASTLLVAALPLLFLLLLIIYFARRRPAEEPYDLSASTDNYGNVDFYHEQSSVTVPAVNAFDVDEDSTEPVRLLKFAATAYLIYEEGGTHLPEKFPLEEGRELRVGRRSNLCDIVIDDKRISRQHSTIISKEDGFYLQDDGSAGGTYLNEKRLGVQDTRKLRHDDIVNFNEIAYRFKVTSRDEDETIIDSGSAVPPKAASADPAATIIDPGYDAPTIPESAPPEVHNNQAEESKDGPYVV